MEAQQESFQESPTSDVLLRFTTQASDARGSTVVELVEAAPSPEPRYVLRLLQRSWYHNAARAHDVPATEARELLASLAELRLSLLPEVGVGTEGTSYELNLKRGSNGVVLRWQDALPPEWQGMTAVLARLDRLRTWKL